MTSRSGNGRLVGDEVVRWAVQVDDGVCRGGGVARGI